MISDGLLGSQVRITIPSRVSAHHVTGTITGLGVPLVRVETNGDTYYRHIEDIELTKRLN